MAKATFGAGCFWGVEDVFMHTPGVTTTRVGYTGGHSKNPSYHDVCSDTTGHAEAVEVTYDPAKISYDQLLKVFWDNHDPTTPNQQGPDFGTQYRSAIFVHDKEQQEAARASKEEQDTTGRFRRPIVTEIVPADEFWEAEDYHQQYFAKRGISHCRT
ncbi:MAG TPA: peptide-methionine (S)-S-oxide reductase MsrA [Chloroflexota bacterium]|nr:peptide-methionine (S)-S-oxide reductase MsrA [Chloroflexota bacterium]